MTDYQSHAGLSINDTWIWGPPACIYWRQGSKKPLVPSPGLVILIGWTSQRIDKLIVNIVKKGLVKFWVTLHGLVASMLSRLLWRLEFGLLSITKWKIPLVWYYKSPESFTQPLRLRRSAWSGKSYLIKCLVM
jgi:hypothetical protein